MERRMERKREGSDGSLSSERRRGDQRPATSAEALAKLPNDHECTHSSEPMQSSLSETIAPTPSATKSKPRKKGGKRKGNKKSDLPARPLNAYNFFFREQRALLVQERATKAPADKMVGTDFFSEMGKEIGSRWRQLRPDQKAKFEQRAEQEKLRYQQEMTAYSLKQSRNAEEAGGTADLAGGIQQRITSSLSQTLPHPISQSMIGRQPLGGNDFTLPAALYQGTNLPSRSAIQSQFDCSDQCSALSQALGRSAGSTSETPPDPTMTLPHSSLQELVQQALPSPNEIDAHLLSLRRGQEASISSILRTSATADLPARVAEILSNFDAPSFSTTAMQAAAAIAQGNSLPTGRIPQAAPANWLLGLNASYNSTPIHSASPYSEYFRSHLQQANAPYVASNQDQGLLQNPGNPRARQHQLEQLLAAANRYGRGPVSGDPDQEHYLDATDRAPM